MKFKGLHVVSIALRSGSIPILGERVDLEEVVRYPKLLIKPGSGLRSLTETAERMLARVKQRKR